MGVTDQIVGNLWVVLNLETGGLDSNVTRVQATLKSFGVEVDKDTLSLIKMGAQAAAIAGAVYIVANELNKAATAAGNFGDAIEDNSRMLGLSVTEYQQWRHVAIASGADAEAFTSAVRMLSVRMEEAGDPTSDYAKRLKSLGIEVTDSTGKMRSMDNVLTQTFAAISRLPDGFEKNQASMEIFGRSWSQIAEMTNLTTEEIKKFKAQSPVISEDDITAMANYHTQQALINEQWEVWNAKVGESTIPLMAEVNIQLISLYVRFVELASAINLASEAATYLFSLGTTGDISGAYSEFESTVNAGDVSMASLRSGTSSTTSKVRNLNDPSVKAERYDKIYGEGAYAKRTGIASYAEGGLITKPTLATFAENEPEYAIPMSKMGNIGGKTIVISPTYQVKTAIDAAQTRKILKANNRDIANKFNMMGA